MKEHTILTGVLFSAFGSLEAAQACIEELVIESEFNSTIIY